MSNNTTKHSTGTTGDVQQCNKTQDRENRRCPTIQQSTGQGQQDMSNNVTKHKTGKTGDVQQCNKTQDRDNRRCPTT
jgi:hypothetical protein